MKNISIIFIILFVFSSCVKSPPPPYTEFSNYSGEFSWQENGVTKYNKIETNFKISSNNKLYGDYNYLYKGVRNSTGKLYDAKIVNNKLELGWEEKNNGRIDKGKLIIDINNDWSKFNGSTIQSDGKISGEWNGKLKEKSGQGAIEHYLNLSK